MSEVSNFDRAMQRLVGVEQTSNDSVLGDSRLRRFAERLNVQDCLEDRLMRMQREVEARVQAEEAERQRALAQRKAQEEALAPKIIPNLSRPVQLERQKKASVSQQMLDFREQFINNSLGATNSAIETAKIVDRRAKFNAEHAIRTVARSKAAFAQKKPPKAMVIAPGSSFSLFGSPSVVIAPTVTYPTTGAALGPLVPSKKNHDTKRAATKQGVPKTRSPQRHRLELTQIHSREMIAQQSNLLSPKGGEGMGSSRTLCPLSPLASPLPQLLVPAATEEAAPDPNKNKRFRHAVRLVLMVLCFQNLDARRHRARELRRKQAARLTKANRLRAQASAVNSQWYVWCNTDSKKRTSDEGIKLLQKIRKRSHFFQFLSEEQQLAIMMMVRMATFGANDNIFVPSWHEEVAFVVVQGEVQVMQLQDKILVCERTLKVGDSFGDSKYKGLPLDSTNRNRIFVAVGSVECLTLKDLQVADIFEQWQKDEQDFKVDFLRRVPVFDCATSDVIRRIACLFTVVRFVQGQEIMVQSKDRITEAYVISDGEVQVTRSFQIKDSTDTKTHVAQVAVLESKELLGEVEMFLPHLSWRLTTAKCLTNVTCLEISRQCFHDHLPEELLSIMCAFSTQRVKAQNVRIKLAVDMLGRFDWVPTQSYAPYFPEIPEYKRRFNIDKLHTTAQRWVSNYVEEDKTEAQVWMPYFSGEWTGVQEIEADAHRMATRLGTALNPEDFNNDPSRLLAAAMEMSRKAKQRTRQDALASITYTDEHTATSTWGSTLAAIKTSHAALRHSIKEADGGD